ncbi:MAG: HAD hydrolase-like protein [Anaerolineae bacterium]
MIALQHWFIDFDETLATGSLTWAQETAFPKLIKQYGLNDDPVLLDRALMVAQEESTRDHDPRRILDELFVTMQWPLDLASVLLTDIYTNYQPRVFDDALSLLERLQKAGRRAFVVSNNPVSGKFVTALGLGDRIETVFTPRTFKDIRPKPYRDVWDLITGMHPEITADNSVIVGDDPWADGEFAQNCGVRCYLVDRTGRFAQHTERFTFEWVRSLDDIRLSE